MSANIASLEARRLLERLNRLASQNSTGEIGSWCEEVRTTVGEEETAAFLQAATGRLLSLLGGLVRNNKLEELADLMYLLSDRTGSLLRTKLRLPVVLLFFGGPMLRDCLTFLLKRRNENTAEDTLYNALCLFQNVNSVSFLLCAKCFPVSLFDW